MNLTEPAVSKALSELEQVLGVRLVDRSRQGCRTDAVWSALLKSAVAIFDDLQARSSARSNSSPTRRWTCEYPRLSRLRQGPLPVVVAGLTRQYPRISIYVTQSPIAVLERRTPQYRDLRERNVDLVLGPMVSPPSKTISTESPFEEKPVVVADNARANRPVVEGRLADLIDEPWCMAPPDTLVGSCCARPFGLTGLTCRNERY